MSNESGPQATWSSAHDDVKAYITLAASLIAISATFSSNLLTTEDQLGRWAVLAAWAVLAGALGTAAFAAGAVFKGMSAGSEDFSGLAGLMNWTVWLVGLGVLCLAFGAWRGTQPSATETGPAAAALDVVVDATAADRGDLRIEAITRNAGQDYEVQVVDQASNKSYSVTIESGSGALISFDSNP